MFIILTSLYQQKFTQNIPAFWGTSEYAFDGLYVHNKNEDTPRMTGSLAIFLRMFDNLLDETSR